MDQKVTEVHLVKIAKLLPQWKIVAKILGLEDQEIKDIEDRYHDGGKQRLEALMKWIGKKGAQATYRSIYEVLQELEEGEAAEKVIALTKGNLFSSTSNDGHQPSGLQMASKASTPERPHSHQYHTTNGPSVAIPSKVLSYSEYLKGVYKKTQVGGDQWPSVKTQHYIKLLTVEKMEDMPKEEDEMFTIARMTSKMEEVKQMQKMKKSISMEQIGTLSSGERASCIIVEGIPGIGKSTFSWHLGVSWAQKKILNDYDLVVLLHLRDERAKHAKCVNDLIYHHDQTTHQTVVQWITSHEGDGVLLILDGYDELPSDLQTSSIFADIIKGDVLPKMTVLVTSRPSANQNLQELCGSQKCQYIEVIGFGKEEIKKYVDGALEHNTKLKKQLKMYLKHHPHIHGLMYIPLNCAIIVQVFRDEMKKKRQPPETVTEVYQVLIKTLVKRHEKKHNSTPTNPNKPSRFAWLIGVSEETILQLLVLAKLAYDGTEKDELIFHWTNGAMETLGLLQEVPQLYLDSSGSSSYNFLHKTVQEYMAALYISSLPPDEKAQIIKTSMKKSNMKIVMRFIAGLTEFQSQDNIKGLVEYLSMDKEELMESLHWLYEAHDPDLVHKCMGDREGELDLSYSSLDPLDCYVLGYCIVNSRKTWKLNLSLCSITEECVKMLMMVEKGKAFDYITEMDLGGNRQLGDEGGIVLGEMLRKNKVLTSLELNACGLVPEGLCKVCSALEENTTLTSLDLSENTFDDQSTTSLGEMLRKNKVLTSLGILWCGLGPEGLCKVCSALEENTTLTSLNLSFNTFDEQSTISLGEMLRKNKVLTSFGLWKCGLSSEGLCKVCSALEENTTLTGLGLSENTFDEQSTTSVVHLLNKNHTLKRLTLWDCGLNDDAIPLLAKGLEHITLEEFYLWENKFTKTGAAELSGVLNNHPNLKVIGLD